MPRKAGALAGALITMLGLVLAGRADAQSPKTGQVSGTVLAGALPLAGAAVTLENPSTGLSRSVETDEAGRFRFLFVTPCACAVAVERLGYRPKRVLGVPVRPKERLSLSVDLVAAPPPVDVVDTVRFGGLAAGVPGETGGWIPAEALERLPSRWRTAWEAERLSSVSDPGLDEGALPVPAGAFSADGFPFATAGHPLFGAELAGAAFPLGWLQGARVVAADPDVETPGATGPTLQVFTRGGSARTEVRAFGNWSGDALTSSRFLPSTVPGHQSAQGGVLVSGLALADSASFAFGLEASRAELALPPTFPASDSLLARYATVAQQSYGVSLDAFRSATVARQDLISGFGRFGWQFSPRSRFDVRASLAALPLPSAASAAGPTPTVKGNEGALGAWLSSELSPGVSTELRVSGERTTREYPDARVGAATAAVAMTTFAASAAPLWGSSSQPGRFTQSAVSATDALYVTAASHQIKLGAGLTVSAYDQSYAPGATGSFAFGGVPQFEQGIGLFRQSVGPTANASFTIPSLAVFAQDAWEVVPALTAQLGVRYEYTHLPRNQIAANTAWRALTGLDNSRFKTSLHAISPRLGLSWDVQDQHQWVVLGSLGLYPASMDPAIVAELITNDGRRSVREGLGSLGQWPASPDSASAPVVGQTLTLLSGGFEPPRSTVGTLGVRRNLGDGMVLELTGTVRHTDRLPRRRDLNLAAQPVALDANGRPVYGQLVQQGSLVAARPGSNRRFSGFDAVWALASTGKADQLAGTLSLRRPVGRSLRLLASYTYSRTTDDWPTSGLAGAPVAVAGDTVGGLDWVNATADLDVPHRAAVGATLQIPGAYGPELSLLYRYRSGLPFTPGFRGAVDINGDGVPGNDPAFLDNAVTGASAVFARWSCLRNQAGRFAERNSCRGPAVQTLDARAALAVVRHGQFALHVVLDGLNLLDADAGLVDPAVFLVDATRSLTTGSGTVAVPLVANPDFGKIVTRLTPGRTLRLGLQVSY